MSAIYDRQHQRIDQYRYKINSGGPFFIKESGFIEFQFVDGKLSDLTFPFKPPYTRNQLRIISSVEEKISKIEKELNN